MLSTVVLPVWVMAATPDTDAGTDDIGLKSLGGSFVVFDVSSGGAPCWESGTSQTLCFRAESFTDDWEYVENLWLRFPSDWTVSSVYVGGSPSCDNGSVGSFAWSFETEPYEINIIQQWAMNSLDHCTVHYCVDVTSGAGSGDQLVSWYWAGDDWGSGPHHPCSDDGYTPSGQDACDESSEPQAVISDCSTFGTLEGTISDAYTSGPTCTTASVAIDPGGATAVADGAGDYGPVHLATGDYDLTASADGFVSAAAPSVPVVAGTITTQDFDLLRPVAGASPTGFDVTVPVDDGGDETLTVSNLGYDPTLDWSLRELPPAASASPLTTTSGEGGSVRIEPELQDQLRADGELSYLIDLRERPDLGPALTMSWNDRGRYVVDSLREAAEWSQARIRAYLDGNRVAYRTFWIDNLIVVESSSREVFDGLLDMSEIEVLRARRTMSVIKPAERKPAASEGRAVEPNLTHVNADDVWQMGFDGGGMVVANIDTGVRYTHEALEPHYRGRIGVGSYSHDYNWLDPDTGSATPTDDHGHGSHTIGIMVGDDGGANQIGIAPGATWIACDACNSFTGCPEAALLTCAEWITAPYPVGDPTSADPTKRPHVVNNSWGDCKTSYDDWYQDSVDAWHAAGIYPVFSNGNASNCGYSTPPGCNTVGNPGRYGNVTGVGSTGQYDGAYATHSNWGPTDNPDTVNPNGYPSVKPNVAAPGVEIRSSLSGSDSDYASWGGTSMSAPHVAGLVALMWQAGPCLIGDYALTEDLIQNTAVAVPYASECGGEGPGNVPNMATGWGEIDALEAVNQAAAYCNTDWLPWVSESPESGQLAFGESEEVTLTFTCGSSPGDEAGTLRLTTNDPCAETTDIPLALHCVPVAPEADLWVDTTDGVAIAVPGDAAGYTIVVGNAGPDEALGAGVADTLPAALLGATWTCAGSGGATCTAAGAGDISDTVDLPVGGTVTYSVSAAIDPGATGVMSNTAAVTSPAGLPDPVPGNNSSTDDTTLSPQADLAVYVTDGSCYVLPGESLSYTVTVENNGLSNAPAASVSDTAPAELTVSSWTCSASGGASCGAASGAGPLNDAPSLPAGSGVTYIVSATVSGSASGALVYMVSASPGAGVSDPVPGNDSNDDSNALELPIFCGDFEGGDTTAWSSTTP
jgi:uncharacterized repeat protein (TIGR01451 family)